MHTLTEGLVLVLDYPGRRPEAHISEMHLEEAGFDCRYLLTHPLPDELGTLPYAKQLWARLSQSAYRPAAVISYCATAPLAVSIAALAAADDCRALPVVFLDPSQCHVHHIADGYVSVVRQIEGRAQRSGRPPLLDVADLLRTPRRLMEQIAEDLTCRASVTLAADGFREAEVSEAMANVIDLYLEWLTYLVAVHHREQPYPAGNLLQIISHNHPQDAGWLGVSAGQTVRINCDRPSLATYQETRAVVLDFLKRSLYDLSSGEGKI
jgi:hypothetical protein